MSTPRFIAWRSGVERWAMHVGRRANRVRSELGGRGARADADRPAAELLDDGRQNLPVDLVETVLVHLEARERLPRRRQIDRVLARDLREVAQPAQETVRDAGRSPAAPRDLLCRVVV